MLNKYYDNTLIGRNFISLTYGLEALRSKNKVILIDDGQTTYGDFFRKNLLHVDLEFLQLWGADHGVRSLEDISSSVTISPTRFVIDGLYLALGGRPFENWRELIRKLPHFFGGTDQSYPVETFLDEGKKQSIDDSFYFLGRKLCQVYFQYQSPDSFSVDELLEHVDVEISKSFYRFKAAWKKLESSHSKESLFWRKFIYMTRGMNHRILDRYINEKDLFHLYLALLSPHYLLDEKKLTESLLATFIQRGGHFKKTTIRQWMFEKGRPWCLELASFEGLIHPQKITFFGSELSHLPVRFSTHRLRYNGVSIDMNIDRTKNPQLAARLAFFFKQRLAYLNSEKVGLETSLWHFSLEEKEQEMNLRVHTFIDAIYGTKISFVEQSLKSQLKGILTDLNFLSDAGEMEHFEISVDHAKDIWSSLGERMGGPQLSEAPTIYNHSVPSQIERLKNVSYHGPLSAASFGLLATMMDVKESALFSWPSL